MLQVNSDWRDGGGYVVRIWIRIGGEYVVVIYGNSDDDDAVVIYGRDRKSVV